MEELRYYRALGLPAGADTGQIKSAYRVLAKKYHPDMNPDNTYAEKMFMLVGEAYRQIEMDHNPALRDARARASNYYEKADGSDQSFKSRRPDSK